MTDIALETLAQMVAEGDALDLGTAALIIATAHYPEVSLHPYQTRLDALATEVQRRVGRARTPERRLAALTDYLFGELGFCGNVTDYYDPANSFLNEVLDRRTGLPITLSILYLAIAHRLGWPLVGVGMPMHFLIKYVTPDREIFLDPFHGGAILSEAECQALLERIAERPVPFDPSYFHETPKHLILYRLLNNLKQVYLRRDEPGRAGRVVEQMLVVLPESLTDVRDRGMLYLQENAFSKGIQWLLRYLEQTPEAHDAGSVREIIGRAQRRRARLN